MGQNVGERSNKCLLFATLTLRLLFYPPKQSQSDEYTPEVITKHDSCTIVYQTN